MPVEFLLPDSNLKRTTGILISTVVSYMQLPIFSNFMNIPLLKGNNLQNNTEMVIDDVLEKRIPQTYFRQHLV